MEKAASQTGNRTDYEQQIGDYWAACMDESGIEAAGTRDLKAGLDRISQMQNKSQLADQVAHLHEDIPGAWDGNDNQTDAALLGFGQQQDFDDATKVVASIDQGGLGLPNRDFYIKDDAKSKEIRSAVRGPHQQDVGAGGRKRTTGRGRRENDHRHRNRHGAGANG